MYVHIFRMKYGYAKHVLIDRQSMDTRHECIKKHIVRKNNRYPAQVHIVRIKNRYTAHAHNVGMKNRYVAHVHIVRMKYDQRGTSVYC